MKIILYDSCKYQFYICSANMAATNNSDNDSYHYYKNQLQSSKGIRKNNCLDCPCQRSCYGSFYF